MIGLLNVLLGIKQLPTTSGHPQCDGLVERFNRTLKAMLTKVVANKGHDWDTVLGTLLCTYRTTVHSSTGETLFFLLYGRDAKLPTGLNFYSPRPKTPVIYSEYGTTLFKKLKRIRKLARKNIHQAQSTQKKQYDKSTHPVIINVGDLVMLQEQPKFKLDCTYQGPYRVYEVSDTNAKVKPITEPDDNMRTVSLQKVSKCRSGMKEEKVWLGHGSRKRRTLRRGGR